MTLHYRVHTQGHLLKPDHCTCLRGLKQGLMRSHRGDVQVLHWTGRHGRTDRTHRRIARAAARRARWSASWSRLISSSVRSKSGSTSSSQGFTASTRPVMRISQLIPQHMQMPYRAQPHTLDAPQNRFLVAIFSASVLKVWASFELQRIHPPCKGVSSLSS